jgi:nucleotide-binding universal stress UspA family protein
VTVAEPPPIWTGSMGPTLYPAWSQVPEDDDDQRQQLTDVATRACGQLARGGLRPTTEVRSGDAAQQLIAAATEDHADLIVVGTRGLTTLSRLVIGSVARKVLLHAPTSVLVIRPSRSPARVTEPTNVMSLAAFA